MGSRLGMLLILAMLALQAPASALDHCVAVHGEVRVQTGSAICIIVDGKNVSIAKGSHALAITGSGDGNVALAMGANALAAAGTGDHNISFASGAGAFSDAAAGSHNIVVAKDSAIVTVRGASNRVLVRGTDFVYIGGLGNSVRIIGDGNGVGLIGDSGSLRIRGNGNIVEVDYATQTRGTVIGSNNFVYFSGVANYTFFVRGDGLSATD